MATRDELLVEVESLKNLLRSYATGGHGENEEYKRLRTELLNEPRVRSTLPRFVPTCRDLSEFWGYIKEKDGTYQERRSYLREQFDPILTLLESEPGAPPDAVVSSTLSRVSSDYVLEVWSEALERRTSDPDGAITMARALLESVCKHILDDAEVDYQQDWDLPKLYYSVANRLDLAPSQHTEKVLKQIAGGAQAVVEGLGALRNRLGDSHGQGKTVVKPEPRHAELAVNLAGAMASFLTATCEARQG